MNDEQERNKGTIRQTLVNIYHPKFREGYQIGRQHYFQKQSVFTDKELVECLQAVFEDGEQEHEEKREEEIYHAVGQLVGQMSGCVIPRHAHEDSTQDPQDAFLLKIMQEYGARGQALIDTIRQFWTIQDQLAQTLDADSFEQMLQRGMERA